MRIDFDDRLDKEYPEPLECSVNDADCTFEVASVCHECGATLCSECRIGVRHQPQPVEYDPADVTDPVTQFHCPDCLDTHTLDPTKVAAGGGGLLVGLFFLLVGAATTPALAVIGLLVAAAGGLFLRHEYRLKYRHHDDYGIRSMW